MRKSLNKWNLRLNNWQNFLKQKKLLTLKYYCSVKNLIHRPPLVVHRLSANGKPLGLIIQVRPRKSLKCLMCLREYQISIISFSSQKVKNNQVTVPRINLHSLLGKKFCYTFQTHLDRSIYRDPWGRHLPVLLPGMINGWS